MNLVINIRYKLATDCTSCRGPVWTCSYYLCCIKYTGEWCRDKVCSIPTAIKWFIYVGLYGFLYFAVKGWNDRQAADFQAGSITVQTNFHINCLVIALMHPIFILARIPIFVVYAILTCCCDKGDDLEEDFPYDKLIISLDYWQKGEEARENGGDVADPFHNRPWDEWRAQNNLRNIRRDTMNLRAQNNPEGDGGGFAASMRREVTKTMKLSLSKSVALTVCPICTMEPEVGEAWFIPPCDKRHMHHWDCMEQFSKRSIKDAHPLFCTLCRVPLKFEDGVKKTIDARPADMPPVLAADAFGDENKADVEMVDLNMKKN